MMDSRMRADLDRYISGGHYQSIPALFKCYYCGHEWPGTVEQEYGMSEYMPHPDCPACGRELDERDWTIDDGPDEDAA